MTGGGLTVAVVFGGPSVEHDVSIITAQQVMSILGERHEVVPVYIASNGRWWSGESLRDVQSFGSQPPAGAEPIELRLGGPTPFMLPSTRRFAKDRDVRVDVVVNAIHGTGGEDGTLLGALELSGLPYVGRGVAASAVSMDKRLAKLVAARAGVEVLPDVHVERSAWEADADAVLEAIVEELGADVVVKPATLGSSIGVSRCTSPDELREALELALELDRQALVEPFVGDAIELNVAVLGRPGGELVASEVERPIGSDSGLSFEDKYLSGGGKASGGSKTDAGAKGGGMASQGRVLPADIDDATRAGIQEQARRAHRALRLAGVVRYDFFALDDGKRLVLNEPNTVPGSFAFYLFEPAGLDFPALMEQLLEIALAEHREERSTVRTFESALLGMHRGA
jgi:D-alanine-D-alanine ligase